MFSEIKSYFDSSPIAFCLINVIRDSKGSVSDIIFNYENSSFLNIKKFFYEKDFWISYIRKVDEDGDVFSKIESYEEEKYMNIQAYMFDKDICACVLLDITEHIMEDKVIKSDKERLMAIVNHADILYWEFDIQNGILLNGEKSVKELGMPKRVDNCPYSIVEGGHIHPDSINDYMQMHIDLLNGEKVTQKAIRINCVYGSVWYLVKYTSVFNSDNKPVRAFATAQNLEMYKKLEQQFSVTSEQNGVFVWTFDFKANSFNQSDSMIENYGKFKVPYNLFEFPQYIIKSGTIHQEDIKNYLNDYERMFSGERVISTKFRKKNIKSGMWDWLKVNYSVFYDSDNNISSIIASGVNINREVEAEKRYNSFKNYREAALKNTVLFIHMNLTDDCCEESYFADKRFNKLSKEGTTRSFFKSFFKHFYDKDELDKYKSIFLRENLIELFYSGQTSTSLSFRYWFNKKEYIWIKVCAEMAQNPETQKIESFVYAFDIDWQKKMQLTVEKLIDIDYVFIGTLNVKSGMINIYGEKSYNNISNFNREKVNYTKKVPDIFKMIIPEKYYDECEKAIRKETIEKSLEIMSSYSFTFPTKKEYGNSYLHWKCVYIDDTKTSILITVTDISDAIKKEMEQKDEIKKALEQAENANKTKNDFLSRMSHDMRTPMNGILGLIHLSKDEDDIDVIKENLSKMHTSANYLLGLINDVLDMSKLEGNKMFIYNTVFDTKDIMESVIASMRPSLEQKNIEFSVKKINTDFLTIKSDPIRLQQIFSNILSNSIKFTRNGGKIEFIAECLHKEGNLSYEKIIIRDNGIGMSKEYLPHLFEPFTLENDPSLSYHSGTGLGLPIVKNIVELMGGKIEVKSEKNVGTEVTIWLTFETVKAVKKTEVIFDKYKNLLNGYNILLCEDHPINTEIAINLLNKVGCKTYCAEDGKIGVEMFEKSKVNFYDAIIMDIRMPNMNGFEATQVIRSLQREDAKTIPIIAMSANAFEEDITMAKEAGMDDYLTKPIIPQKVYECLVNNICK